VEEGALVATPAQVDVWIGLDVGKGEHFADVPGNDGEQLFARAAGWQRIGEASIDLPDGITLHEAIYALNSNPAAT
jgi:hypothetical protein